MLVRWGSPTPETGAETPSVGGGVGTVVGGGVGTVVAAVGEGVNEAVGEGVDGGGASATKLTLAGVEGIPVTQSVRFVAVRRLHLSEAVMDPAVGCASYTMAASPETCGQAMDVPDRV
jgi:hypothetical protein